ncbi:uncharacterized protein LOC127084183 isoform X1 [Lathyrus oleraceus]|uniref:uncharacterized protein LOC127084183 isoform X1 n=1 Tax=Pisum sativum TaxID=3888 RepID=UPI0021D14D3D|nr:uncharacterized protein LOC127084183 isoform X1 [Pisum sativum]
MHVPENTSSIMLHLSSVKHTCVKLSTRIGACVWEKEENSGDERSKCIYGCTMGCEKKKKMIDDEALGFIANSLGIFIFALVIAYHLVIADPNYEGN